MKFKSITRIAILFGISCAQIPYATRARATDWLQFGFDAAHSGSNVEETSIADNLAAITLLYQVALPATADGAPVYLGGVDTAAGSLNLLFVTTSDGHLVAIDADAGAVVWSQQAATGPAGKTSSSPAIDPNRQFVYSFGLDGKVHKYTVADGTEIVDASWPEIATLKPYFEKGSSALTFATAADGRTFLYATTSNMAYDSGDYQGHITAIDLSSGEQTVFNTLCSDRPVHFVYSGQGDDCENVQAGIWNRPGVTYDAANDRLYTATGNGPFTGDTDGRNWGESVLALSPSLRDGSGAPLSKPLDSFTPSNYQSLNDSDYDLGVSAPAILPTPAGGKIAHAGVQVGKDGVLRILNLDDLSRAGGPGHLDGQLSQITNLSFYGFTSNQAAVWIDPQTHIGWYLLACQEAEYGFMVGTGAFGGTTLIQTWSRTIEGAGGGSPVVANGIEFVVEQSNLVGLDPKTGTQQWSMPIAGVHWASPIVVDGKIFLADGNATISAYGVPSIHGLILPSAIPRKPSAKAYTAPSPPTVSPPLRSSYNN